MQSIIKRFIAGAFFPLLGVALLIPFQETILASEAAAPIITSVAVGSPRGVGDTRTTLAYIEQDNYVEQDNIIKVRTIDRRTGLSEGRDLVLPFSAGRSVASPVRLLFSSLISPGSLLVLDSSLKVHEYPLGFADDGTPFVAGPTEVIGPFGDPSLVGEATAFAEAPGSAGGAATLVLGTKLGQIIAVLIGIRTPAQLSISSDPIDDLAVIPQVGHFEFVAVTNGRLIGINADADARTPGLQPAATFSLASPLGGRGISDIGAQIQDGTSNTLRDPVPVRVVAANGTSDIFLFEIPATPGARGSLTLQDIDHVGTAISQVAVGSLVALAADGAGVLYQPLFTVERGFVGPVFTVAGASLRLDPQALNLRSSGRYVTAFIKAANGGGAEINTDSVSFKVEGVKGSVFAAGSFKPECEDDECERAVLVVKIERNELKRLLAGVRGDVATGQATWTSTDGSVGAASSQVRIIR